MHRNTLKSVLSIRLHNMLNQPQVVVFIRSSRQLTRFVLGDKGVVTRDADTNYALSLFQNIRTVFLQGGHHFYMDNHSELQLLSGAYPGCGEPGS